MQIESIQKVNVGPGDVLVLRFAGGFASREVRDTFRAELAARTGVLADRILLLERGMTLDVLSTESRAGTAQPAR